MERDRKIPVDIRICGFHLSEGEDSDITESSYGYFSKKGDSIFLVFESAEGIRTLIKIHYKTVEVKKSIDGKPAADILYEEGKSLTGFYQTPFGRFELETDTGSVEVEEMYTSLRCRIKGKLKIYGSNVSDFNLEINAATVN